jgi:hypothetical protein
VDAMIWGKAEEEIDKKVHHWNLIMKEHGLKMNMDKTLTMRISKHLCQNIKIKENNTTVKQGVILFIGK